MKRYVSAAVAIAVLLTSFAFYVPIVKAADSKTGTVNTQDANLRQEPSTASDVVTKMNLGDTVDILETDNGGWYKVKYKDNTGYVRTDFIDVMVTGLDEMAFVMIDTQMTQKPDPASAAVTKIAANTQVTITGEYGDTYQIRSGSQNGYVPKTSVHKVRVMSIGLKATISKAGINLRSTPSESGESIDKPNKGQPVTVESIADSWAKISYSGKEGYVKGDFIKYNVSNNISEMYPGMQGQAVKTVQLALKKKGLFYPAANGIYGSATKTAIKKFQDSIGLHADGIAGRQTLLLLIGSTQMGSLWNNYRTRDDVKPQKPQHSGKVYLWDWFDNGSQQGMQSIMQKFVPFEVIDVRTGIHWNMERFGDSTCHNHADVCPMTKADTAAMTKAWNNGKSGGVLNDSRRPVWVKYGGKYYAAGLMGFVHNTSPIKDNGMNGQVCLHFRGSTLHVKPALHVDEAQQACVMEAFANANKLNDYIAGGRV